MGTSGNKCVFFGHNILTSAFIVLRIRYIDKGCQYQLGTLYFCICQMGISWSGYRIFDLKYEVRILQEI